MISAFSNHWINHGVRQSILLFTIIPLFLAQGCDTGSEKQQPSSIHTGDKYIFIGHPYKRLSRENLIDDRIASIDFTPYNGIWWGGDLTPYKLKTQNQIRALDSAAHVSDYKTLWAIGNHDYSPESASLIEEFTGKSCPICVDQGNVRLFVMNSSFEKDDCQAWDDQIQLFRDCVNSCPEGSSFVLMSHHAIWANLLAVDTLDAIANAHVSGLLLSCSIDINFENTYYPLLLQLKEEGHQVICLSGDAGTKQLKTGYWSRDQIQFILAGIGESFYTRGRKQTLRLPDGIERDKAVEFTQTEDSLSWNFLTIDELLKNATPV